ncbi:hypothetical protein DIPPA_53811, partial [Diplonema papillatum]
MDPSKERHRRGLLDNASRRLSEVRELLATCQIRVLCAESLLNRRPRPSATNRCTAGLQGRPPTATPVPHPCRGGESVLDEPFLTTARRDVLALSPKGSDTPKANAEDAAQRRKATGTASSPPLVPWQVPRGPAGAPGDPLLSVGTNSERKDPAVSPPPPHESIPEVFDDETFRTTEHASTVVISWPADAPGTSRYLCADRSSDRNNAAPPAPSEGIPNDSDLGQAFKATATATSIPLVSRQVARGPAGAPGTSLPLAVGASSDRKDPAVSSPPPARRSIPEVFDDETCRTTEHAGTVVISWPADAPGTSQYLCVDRSSDRKNAAAPPAPHGEIPEDGDVDRAFKATEGASTVVISLPTTHEAADAFGTSPRICADTNSVLQNEALPLPPVHRGKPERYDLQQMLQATEDTGSTVVITLPTTPGPADSGASGRLYVENNSHRKKAAAPPPPTLNRGILEVADSEHTVTPAKNAGNTVAISLPTTRVPADASGTLPRPCVDMNSECRNEALLLSPAHRGKLEGDDLERMSKTSETASTNTVVISFPTTQGEAAGAWGTRPHLCVAANFDRENAAVPPPATLRGTLRINHSKHMFSSTENGGSALVISLRESAADASPHFRVDTNSDRNHAAVPPPPAHRGKLQGDSLQRISKTSQKTSCTAVVSLPATLEAADASGTPPHLCVDTNCKNAAVPPTLRGTLGVNDSEHIFTSTENRSSTVVISSPTSREPAFGASPQFWVDTNSGRRNATAPPAHPHADKLELDTFVRTPGATENARAGTVAMQCLRAPSQPLRALDEQIGCLQPASVLGRRDESFGRKEENARRCPSGPAPSCADPQTEGSQPASDGNCGRGCRSRDTTTTVSRPVPQCQHPAIRALVPLSPVLRPPSTPPSAPERARDERVETLHPVSMISLAPPCGEKAVGGAAVAQSPGRKDDTTVSKQETPCPISPCGYSSSSGESENTSSSSRGTTTVSRPIAQRQHTALRALSPVRSPSTPPLAPGTARDGRGVPLSPASMVSLAPCRGQTVVAALKVQPPG